MSKGEMVDSDGAAMKILERDLELVLTDGEGAKQHVESYPESFLEVQ